MCPQRSVERRLTPVRHDEGEREREKVRGRVTVWVDEVEATTTTRGSPTRRETADPLKSGAVGLRLGNDVPGQASPQICPTLATSAGSCVQKRSSRDERSSFHPIPRLPVESRDEALTVAAASDGPAASGHLDELRPSRQHTARVAHRRAAGPACKRATEAHG